MLTTSQTLSVNNTVVRTSGDQSIGGTKTIVDNLSAKSNVIVDGNVGIGSSGTLTT
jgi:hypothetical protein